MHNVPYDQRGEWIADINRQNETAANILRVMGRRGNSAYDIVDAAGKHDIPAHACRGRTGAQMPFTGKTFSGYLDLDNGKMRFDCVEDSSFWLEIDLNQVPLLSLAPGGREYEAAVTEFENAAGAARERD